MKLVRGMVAGALLTVFGATLGACGPIGVLDSHLIEPGKSAITALDGYVRFSAPDGATAGAPRVSFTREPLPADRPVSPGIVTVGDMVTIEIDGGAINRGRITIDYGALPARIAPDMLNVFAWSTPLGGWVPLTGTLTDAVDRSISGDTVLFDSFVLGTWQLTSDETTGDAISTGGGALLPVKFGTTRSFWAYARAAAASSMAGTVEHLTGVTPDVTTGTTTATGTPAGNPLVKKTVTRRTGVTLDALVCTPKAADVPVRIASVPAGRADACVVSGTGSQLVKVRNKYPFPLVLRIPTDSGITPVTDAETTETGTTGSVDGIRNTVLTYLNGEVAIGGGQTVTLKLPPGRRAPIRLRGRLDWSVVALDAGLRQLDLLLPNSRAMRPGTPEALLLAHAEYGTAARDALARGDASDQTVRALMLKTGLAGAEQSVADLFEFSACVLRRTPDIAGVSTDALVALKTTGPSITRITSDCLSIIYDKYLPPGSRSANAVLDTLESTTSTVRKSIPKADRKRGYGQVLVTLTPR